MNTQEIAQKLAEELKADGIEKPYADNCDLNQYLIDVLEKEGQEKLLSLNLIDQIPILNEILNQIP